MDGIGFKIKSLPRGAHYKKIGGCRTRKTAHQQTDRETVEPERTKVLAKTNPYYLVGLKCTRGKPEPPQQPNKRKTSNRIQGASTRSAPSTLETNDDFTQNFILQLKTLNIKCAEVALLKSINSEVTSVNKVINGTMDSNIKISNKPLDSLREEASTSNSKDSKVELIPCSKWVYETPDKQRIKRMDELDLEVLPALEPAVIERTENQKIVYGLNEKVCNKVDLTGFQVGQEVPINRAYLTPLNLPKLKPAPVEENQFLTQNNELTINIEDDSKSYVNSRKRKHEGDNDLTWYEKHMKTLATCRPVKEKTDRRNLLLRKSLSFQEETPTSHLRMKSRFRSLDENESYRSHTEDECSLLDEDFYAGEEFRQGETPPEPNSPQLSLILGNVSINNTLFNEIPAPKFYPRKNYD